MVVSGGRDSPRLAVVSGPGHELVSAHRGRVVRILAVAPYVPYEGILHAGGSYLLHHLEEMTRLGNQVTLIVPGTPAQLGMCGWLPSGLMSSWAHRWWMVELRRGACWMRRIAER